MKYEAGHLGSWADRRKLLIEFQTSLIAEFGEDDYNIFVFGSFIRSDFQDGLSDIDMIVYCQDRGKQTDIFLFSDRFFKEIGFPADIIEFCFIERAFIYPHAILNSIALTDYYPEQLRADLYIIMLEYSQYQLEQETLKKYLKWDYIVKKYIDEHDVGEREVANG